tara:strand:- start:5417 stop:5707 length:291 start_codon:yes stop_codon:yes gene_type:complete
MFSEDNEEQNLESQNEMDRIKAEAAMKYQKILELEKSMIDGYTAIKIGGIEVLEPYKSDGSIDVKETLQIMIDHFADPSREEYEKCAFLHNILINL